MTCLDLEILHRVALANLVLFVALFGPASTHAAPDCPALIYSGDTPTALAVNGTHLFAALDGSSLETCAVLEVENPLIVRISLADFTDVQVLLEGCHGAIATMVADSSFLYYRGSDTFLYRLSTAPGGVSLVLSSEGALPARIAMDDTHVYWAAGDATQSHVYRTPKDGGPDELIASFDDQGHTIRGLVVDATHVYWAEGEIGSGAIRRAPKAGGAVQELAGPGDGLDHTWTLAVDDTFVFFGGVSSGQVRRVPKSGGEVLELISGIDSAEEIEELGGYMVESIGVTPNYVVWTDTTGDFDARVRRVERDSGAVGEGEITLLQQFAFGTGNVLFAGSHFFWSQSGEIYRTEVDSAGVAVDLAATQIELTQGLSILDSMPATDPPLVAGKDTYVRAYVSLEYEFATLDYFEQDVVSAQLRGYRDGAELPESPLAPVVDRKTVSSDGSSRSDLPSTFNFVLPLTWSEGGLELRFEVNPEPTIPETDFTNNVVERVYTFEDVGPICLLLVPVEANGAVPNAVDFRMDYILDFAQIHFPVTRFHRKGREPIHEAGGPYEIPDDSKKILTRLGAIDIFDTAFDVPGCRRFVGGVVWPPKTSTTRGSSRTRQFWFTSYITDNPSTSIVQRLYFEDNYGTLAMHANIPNGAITAVHEISHLLGRDHIDCGGPPEIDPDYPHDPCTIGEVMGAEYWGFDRRQFRNVYSDSWTVLDPNRAVLTPVMSYGQFRWTSDYTLHALYGAIGSGGGGGGGGGAPDADLSPSDVVLLLGGVTEGAGAEIEVLMSKLLDGELFTDAQLARLDAERRETLDPSGDWRLLLRDGAGAVLETHRFESRHGSDDDAGEGSFLFALAYPPGAQGLSLVHESGTSADIVQSATAPLVQVESPNGGESLDGDILVEWDAIDADGDPLTFDVLYSADDGATWTLVTQDVAGDFYRVERPLSLPGGSSLCRVRVIANDGLLSAVDESDEPFSVENRTPVPRIVQPLDGAVLGEGQIVLRATATDAEDGLVAPDGIAWIIDGTPRGFGEHITVHDLEIGRHTAVVRVADSHGAGAVDSIEFWIVPHACQIRDRRIEVVFLMEVSSLMSLHAEEACERIAAVTSVLEDIGLEVRSEVVALRDEAPCSKRSVRQIDPAAPVLAENQWQLGVESLARAYPWTEDHTRVIVPVVKQLPSAPRGEAPATAEALVSQAIVEANNASVSVFPWLLPLTSTPPSAELLRVGGELARKTCGALLDWFSDDDAAALAIYGTKAKLACPPTVRGFLPDGSITADAEIVVYGTNLWPGIDVYLGLDRARNIVASPGGGAVRFRPPLDIFPGIYEVKVIRRGTAFEARAAHPLRIEERGRSVANRRIDAVRYVQRFGKPGVVEIDWSVLVLPFGASAVDWSFEYSVERVGETLGRGEISRLYSGSGSPCEGEGPPACPPGYDCREVQGFKLCQLSGTARVPVSTRDGDLVTVGLSPSEGSVGDPETEDDTMELLISTSAPQFRRGDCNDDGTVDISDAVFGLGFLFLGQGDPGCDDACDSNDDGIVDISDSIHTLGVLFLGAGVIPLPGMTDCGVDPTDDRIGCETAPESCP